MELIKSSKGDFLSPFWSDLFNNERFFGNRLSLLDPVFSSPPANVIENKNSFRIELAAPGFSKEDFDIEIEDNFLSISAEKKEESEEEEDRYARKEFRYESFNRSFTLPQICEGSEIEANYTNGVLSLVIPKKEAISNRTKKEIKIK